MALVVKDRVRETTTTTGTGTITLGGAATGFQSFSVIGNGNTTFYTIQLANTNEWEVGIGTYTSSGTTLSRDTILESSNGGSAVNFSAGTKDVFVTYPAEKAIYDDANGDVIALGTPASVTLTNGTGLPLSTGVTGTLPVANGGTNQTSYTNGQLLIGNTTGNTLTKSTITAGTGISVTNGAGSITIANSAPSIAWQSVQTANFTATAGSGYPINTTSSAITVTLPASPTAGDAITLTDYASKWATNNVTIGVNGNKLNGVVVNALLSTNRQSISLVYIDATQGWISYSGFIDNIPAQTYSIDFLVVAGGGGGGGTYAGGGGGAGGYRTSTQSVNPGTVITVTVGDGGAGGGNQSGAPGSTGSNSSISGSGLTTITSNGGGGGGTNSPNASATSGGSGGGGVAQATTAGSGNTPSTSPSQGNNGGAGVAGGSTGSGGGGAGAVGGLAGPGDVGGAGGAGSASSITGSSVTRAGGGGGGGLSAGGAGGTGGGGAGSSGAGSAGTANTGGGGGGSDRTPTAVGGAGGKGVVILSVPTANYSATSTGSPTVTTSGSNTILQFNGSGSYTT